MTAEDAVINPESVCFPSTWKYLGGTRYSMGAAKDGRRIESGVVCLWARLADK